MTTSTRPRAKPVDEAERSIEGAGGGVDHPSESFTLISDTMISTIRKTPPPTAILATISGCQRYLLDERDEFSRLDREIGGDRRCAPGDQRQHLAREAAHQREQARDEHDAGEDEVEKLKRHGRP